MISKAFHYVLRVSERSPLVGWSSANVTVQALWLWTMYIISFSGPPESMREHVVAAANAMRTGDWQACREYMLDVKVYFLLLVDTLLLVVVILNDC